MSDLINFVLINKTVSYNINFVLTRLRLSIIYYKAVEIASASISFIKIPNIVFKQSRCKLRFIIVNQANTMDIK